MVKKNAKPNNGGYKVGYGKPPKHTQFKKGKSGNPSGKSKPKKSIAELIVEEGEKMVAVTENGQQTLVSKMELLAKSVFANAIKGDHKSIALILHNQPSVEAEVYSGLEGFSWTEEHEELLRAARDEDNPIL